MRFLARLFDLMLLSLLTALCCAAVIPAAAALCALYALTLKMVRREEGGIFLGFFAALRKNFIAGTPAAMLLFADAVPVLLLYNAFTADTFLFSPAVLGLLLAATLLLTALLAWLFPLLARFENPFPRQLVNAAKLAVARLPVTCLLVCIDLLPLLLILAWPNAAVPVLVFWLVFGIGAGAYAGAFYLRRVFDGLEQD